MVKCFICYKKYATLSSLNRHRKEMHGPKKLCPYCLNYYGRLQPHFSSCKKYQQYQLNKLKIIDGNIFITNTPIKVIQNEKIKPIYIKKDFFINAKQINKTNFFFFPEMKLGEGSFCEVFYGINKKSNQECAIKFFKGKKENITQFIMEKSMLEDLDTLLSFPSLFYYSEQDLILVESLHGPNLRQLFEFCDKKFPLQTVCLIGIEMINRLKEFHSKGFIHRDIKPSNFVWGKFSGNLNELKDHILLIDYDLSYKYKIDNGAHISFQTEDSIVGNLTYKSINANDYINQTRRDDLESVIYCLIYFLKSDLPWNKESVNYAYKKLNKKFLKKGNLIDDENFNLVSKERIICQYKKCIPVKVLCEELPTEFELLVYYVRNLKYDEEPNYEIMVDLLKRIIMNNTNNAEEGQYKYIWQKKFVDILNEPYKIKKGKLDKLKCELFSGYKIEMEKFIRDVKKIEIFNYQSIKSI